MKIWTNNRSNNVHTQKAPLQYRATLHRTTRTILASLVGKLSPKSTQCTPLHRFGIHWRKMGKKGPGQNNPEKEEN
jgi:hypothetical protein